MVFQAGCELVQAALRSSPLKSTHSAPAPLAFSCFSKANIYSYLITTALPVFCLEDSSPVIPMDFPQFIQVSSEKEDMPSLATLKTLNSLLLPCPIELVAVLMDWFVS